MPPPQQLFAAEDRRVAQAVAALDYLNPFLPERTELERRALGPAFDEASGGWQLSPDAEPENPNVLRIMELASATVHRVRKRLDGSLRPSADDLQLYEDLVLFHLYHRYRPHLGAVVEGALAGEAGRPTIPFYKEFEQDAEHLLRPPGITLPGDYPPEHLFAFLFQLNRAFHLIYGYLVGGSRAAIRLRASIWQSIFTHDLRRYVRSVYTRFNDISTLITGPSGTGKELVARAIGHSGYIPFDRASRRFTHGFVDLCYPLNLSALSPTLIESELFGHRKGAFTGALENHPGWFESSDPLGAVFLDEIGEISSGIQVKLLRVLESRTFQRLGETTPRRFEGRVLCATNRDLPAEIQAGNFRADLFYRICSDMVVTPSLAEQIQESEAERHRLVLFIARRMLGPDGDALAEEAEHWIAHHLAPDYDWPGNFRELEQCVRNVLIRGEYHPTNRPPRTPIETLSRDLAAGSLSAEALLRGYTNHVYRQTGTYEATARRLGVDRRTVRSRIDSDPDA
jgi:hypothetical protein